MFIGYFKVILKNKLTQKIFKKQNQHSFDCEHRPTPAFLAENRVS